MLKKYYNLFLASLIVKLVVSALLPLSNDEAYYWVWSQKPQLSYFDHPPMVAWLFWLGNLFQGIGNAVRWPAVLLGHLTILVWIEIWEILFPDLPKKKLSWLIGLILFSPLLGFGSIILTPDLPVVFFWSLATLFLVRSINNPTIENYSFLGSSLGLGFASKYHIVLFVPMVVAYLTLERKWKLLSFSKILFTIFFGLIFSAPVLIWNYQNDFQSFLFQINHGLGRKDYSVSWTWTYVLAQVLVIFPPVFYLAIRAKLKSTSRVLYYLAWGPLLFFLLSSFKGLVEINWPIIAYPSVLVLAAINMKSDRVLKIFASFWTGIFIFLVSLLIVPWFPGAPEKIEELTQFKVISEVRKKYDPLYASTYQMASWVWYDTQMPFFKLNQMSRRDIFDDFIEGVPTQYPIYVAMKENTSLPDWVNEKKLVVTEIERLPNQFVVIKIEQQ